MFALVAIGCFEDLSFFFSCYVFMCMISLAICHVSFARVWFFSSVDLFVLLLGMIVMRRMLVHQTMFSNEFKIISFTLTPLDSNHTQQNKFDFLQLSSANHNSQSSCTGQDHGPLLPILQPPHLGSDFKGSQLSSESSENKPSPRHHTKYLDKNAYSKQVLLGWFLGTSPRVFSTRYL